MLGDLEIVRHRFLVEEGYERQINRAIRAGIMEEIRKPVYAEKRDAHAGDPPNAAPDPTERLDIPLIGWQFIKTHQHSVIFPMWWKSKHFRSQIHPTSTYRLNNDTGAVKIAGLIELGELILDIHQSFEVELKSEAAACWKNLKGFLENQHHDMKEHYKFTLQHANDAFHAFHGALERTTMALYLASSLTRLWPPLGSFHVRKPSTSSRGHLLPPPSAILYGWD